MKYCEFLPEILTQKRKQAGHTPETAARAIGCRTDWYLSLEKGTDKPSLVWARRIAEVLGCQVSDFYV